MKNSQTGKPEKRGTFESSSWVRGAMLTTGIAVASMENGCIGDGCGTSEVTSERTVEIIEEKERQVETRSGDWELQSTAIAPILADSEYDNYFSFLRVTFANEDWYRSLPAVDQRAYIEGYIAMTRQLNPAVSLDTWDGVKGSTIMFPVDVRVTPSFERVIRKGVGGGYERLQDLAEADGFPIRDLGRTQSIYENALKSGFPLPSSNFFFRDIEGSEDSPDRLAPDVHERLLAIGEQFGARSFSSTGSGWAFAITDILGDANRQKTRDSRPDGTHPTGRSFDVADGRFRHPDGNVVTWSRFQDGKPVGSGPFANIIEKELRPALEDLMLDNGLLPYAERGHWHVYAPKERVIDLRRLAVAKTEGQETSVAVELPAPRSEALLAAQSRLRRAMEVQADTERDMGAAVRLERASLLVPDVLTKRKDLERPILTALQFPTSREGEGLEGVDIAALRASGALDTLRTKEMLRGRVKEEMIQAIRAMSPDEIIRHGVFEGTTVHNPKKVPFFDLEDAWHWKINTPRVSSADVKEFGPYVEKRLKGKDRSVTLEKWVERQQVASDTFARHAEQLGYSAELTKYLTPDVLLSVIHAEFFSELDGPTFVRLAPALFETYNIAYGPAVNDKLFSGGLVQMTRSTFEDTLRRQGKVLEVIRKEDKEARFIVPEKVPTGKKGKKVYDRQQFVDAMLTDLDSQLFYNVMAVADHLRLGFPLLMKDPNFSHAWANAKEEDRYRFIGAFAPLAINGGVGHAQGVAEKLINLKGRELAPMAAQLETLSGKPTASRGAARGLSTMNYLIEVGNSDRVAGRDE